MLNFRLKFFVRYLVNSHTLIRSYVKRKVFFEFESIDSIFIFLYFLTKIESSIESLKRKWGKIIAFALMAKKNG